MKESGSGWCKHEEKVATDDVPTRVEGVLREEVAGSHDVVAEEAVVGERRPL